MNERHKAKKSLGQNFLEDRAYVGRIISHIRPRTGECIVEIGPGRAALTDGLVASGAAVIAVELDRDLTPRLRERFAGERNFRVIEADALTVDFRRLAEAENRKLRLAANLPYYISTAILQRLIDARDSFTDLTLMFQLEVAERITAEPGAAGRGFLTVMVEAYFETRKLFDVPRSAFQPIPKVDSAVVALVPRVAGSPPLSKFRPLVSAAFAQKRKTIFNNLRPRFADAREVLLRAAIDPSRRAESLTSAEWLALLKAADDSSAA